MARRRKNNRKWLVGVGILILVIIGVALGVMRPWEKRFSEGEQVDVPVDTVGNVVTEPVSVPEPVPEPETEVVEKEEVKQYEGGDPNSAEVLTGVVTYAGASGDYLMIRVNIDQYLSGGTCRLVLNGSGGLAYTETAAVTDAAATATCEGFNVSLGKLKETQYNIIVYVDATDGRSGEIQGEARI